MKTSIFAVLLIAAAVLLVGGFIATDSARPTLTWHTNSQGKEHRMTVYKSPTCGCCGIHADYLESNGYKVETVDTEDMQSVKEKYSVPESTLSCHTTVVNDGQYFIEGHIPDEAISRLLEQEPEISGIGMPGMPSGSPGMAGQKEGPFEVMQIDKSGQVGPYMSI